MPPKEAFSKDFSLEDRLLTPKEVADYLRVTTGTLSVWRSTKRYPLPFVRVGTKIFYRSSAVADFVAAREGLETTHRQQDCKL
jgi:excisionase family DNA binding protein